MGLYRSVSPSPSKRSSISTDDENEENCNPVMFRGNTTPRHKRSATKNYMAPTFSAASKAITPKKKTILADRNSASDASSSSSSDPEPEIKNPVLGSPMPTATTTIKNGDDTDEKPYDPQTNFLSPRPRFLRYDPERRREIFRDSVSSDANSSDSSSAFIAGEIGGLKLTDDDHQETKTPQVEADSEVEEEVKESDEEATEEEEEEETSDESEESEEEVIVEASDEPEEAEAEEEEEEEEYEWRGGTVMTVILMLILGLLTIFLVSVNHSRSLHSPPLMFGRDVSNEFGRRIVLNNSVEDLLLNRIKARTDFSLEEKVDQGNQVEEKGFEELSQMNISKSVVVLQEQEIEEMPCQVVEDFKLEGEEENQVLEASFESPLSEPIKEEEEKQLTFFEAVKGEEEQVTLSEPVEEEEVTNKTHGENKVAGYLIESLKRIEAEFAVKLFLGLVSIVSVIAYFFSQAPKKKPSEKKIIGKKEEELDDHHHQHQNQVYSFTDNLSYTQSHCPSVEFLSEFDVSSQNTISEDSPLYQSFGARGDKEGMVTPGSKRSSRKYSVMTPVRRSDRIRSRMIKSPIQKVLV